MNGEAATKRLSEIAAEITGHRYSDVGAVSAAVLTNPKFPVWSGSSRPNQHHYGDGGLATHTLEVVELCLANQKFFANLGRGVEEPFANQKIFLAALFHDAGKMWDYQKTNQDQDRPPAELWKSTPHKRLVYHISRSGLVWTQAVYETGLFQAQEEEILHAILAHHGLREWGSPVQPCNRLAWLLHLCDNMSARMYDCYTLPR